MQRTFCSEDDLRAFAAAFAKRLRAGDVVALSGALGSGKTTFVRAAVEARTQSDPATSPTFTFWHRYPGTPPIDHLDFYRIDDPRAVAELGLEDVFDGGSIVFVEWWHNAEHIVPKRRFEVDIDGKGDGPRIVRLSERP